MPKYEANMPQKPGYYWGRWMIPADGTIEGDDMTPAFDWEIVQVNDNNGTPGTLEELSVAVPGVQQTQWRDCFLWGDFVAPLAQDGKKP